jgi:hypothetical protein
MANLGSVLAAQKTLFLLQLFEINYSDWMEIYIACISIDLRKQNVLIFILYITVAFRVVFSQIHV